MFSDSLEIFKTMIILLGVTVCIEMLVSYKFPKITSKIVKPIKHN
jgi:hypothetical protein